MILRRRHAAIAALLLCPHDVYGAHHHGHHAFVSPPPIINNDAARLQRSFQLEYSKDHENDVNIWLPTEHIASTAAASAASAKSSHGWDNFPTSSSSPVDYNTEIDHDNYNNIDDWVDAKKRRSRRLQSLEDVNVENSKKLNYRVREQEKVEEWRRVRNQDHSATTSTSASQQQPLIDETSTTNNTNSYRLDLPYNDRSQLSAIQSNAPAILLPSGPGTGKSHVLSLRIAYLLQKWVHHWQQQSRQQQSTNTAAAVGEEEVCSPDSMIILSFTNSDALRLKERALDYLYPTSSSSSSTDTTTIMRNQTAKSLWSGTMHAFSLAILNKYVSSSTAPPLRVLPAREMKNRVAASLRSLLDGGATDTDNDNDSSKKNRNNNAQTEGWYRELQLRHIQTLNDVGHSRSILFQNIVRCIDLWKEANMPLVSADNHFTVVKREGDDGSRISDEEGVRSDCVELAMRLGIPKSSALLALDVFPEYQVSVVLFFSCKPTLLY